MQGTPGCVRSLMGPCGRGNFSMGSTQKRQTSNWILKKDLEIQCFCGSCTTFKEHWRASLVAQLVKNPPANAGEVGSIQLWEDPTCCGARKPVRRNCWPCALAPGTQDPGPAATELCVWQSAPCNRRSHHSERPPPLQLEKSPQNNEPKINQNSLCLFFF